MSPGRAWLRLAIGALLLAGLAIFCARNLVVSTEITYFLASADDARSAELARALAGSASARTLVLSVGGPQTEAIAAAKELATRIAERPEVAWVRGGPAADLPEAVHALYFERRFRFLSDRPEELPARFSDAGLAQTAEDLERALRGPMAPLVSVLAPEDPYLAFTHLLERFQAARPAGVQVRNGQFVSADGGHALVFLASRASPFDSASSAPLVAAIDAAFASVNATRGGGLVLEKSGVHVFAVDAERHMRDDMARISTLATIGVLGLVWISFRSFRMVAIASLPLLAGMVVATAGGIVLFGTLHGLTLAFGASLIGVAVDYPTHLAAHHLLALHRTDVATSVRNVRTGILLAAATTFAGFAALAGARLPGIRELGVFSLLGLGAALATTFWLVPALLVTSPPAPPGSMRAADGLARAITWITRRPRAAAGVALAVLVFSGSGLLRVRFEDDVAKLSPMDPALFAEDARVRERVGASETGRAVFAVAADRETALRLNDAVALRLDAARRAGAIDEYQSLHRFLWSRALQDRNLETIQATPQLYERTRAALAARGFRPELFTPLREALAARPPPVTLDELLATPLAELVRPFEVPVGDQTSFVSFLRGVRDAPALERALEGLEGVDMVDQHSFVESSFRAFRDQTLRLVGLGLVGVVALLALRYRSPGAVLAAFLPAFLAAAATAAGFAWLGTPLHLVHLLGLLLVLSMGVDYGVFLVEAARGGESEEHDMLGASAFGVVLDCATTALSFGLLALSTNPALYALGVTIAVGVVLSLVLAPVALVAARPAATSHG